MCVHMAKAMATTFEGSINRDAIPIAERRWVEVENIRKLLKGIDIDISDPLVLRSHSPIEYG